MIIAHPTTEEHYAKYLDLCNSLRFSLSPSEFKGGIPGLRKEYLKDIHLNTIPLKWWDCKAFRIHLPSKGLSLAEKVCICKHYAIYNLLEAYPIFYVYAKPNMLTVEGFTDLSAVSKLSWLRLGEDKEKYEEWAETMRKSFAQAQLEPTLFS